MTLPNPDPGAGPSFTVCIGETWRPPIAGLLEQMSDDQFWWFYAFRQGVTLTDAEVRAYTDAADRILGRIGTPSGVLSGCPDLEPPSGGVPSFGTTYSKTYSFLAGVTPTGWTIIRGTPSGSGVHSSDLAAGGVGWQRRITVRLALLQPAHTRLWQPKYLINSTFLSANAFFLGGTFQSSSGRSVLQCTYPDVGNWQPAVSSQQMYATANELVLTMQIDEKVGSSDLLGEAWLQNVYVEVSSTTGNPLP